MFCKLQSTFWRRHYTSNSFFIHFTLNVTENFLDTPNTTKWNQNTTKHQTQRMHGFGECFRIKFHLKATRHSSLPLCYPHFIHSMSSLLCILYDKYFGISIFTLFSFVYLVFFFIFYDNTLSSTRIFYLTHENKIQSHWHVLPISFLFAPSTHVFIHSN